MLRQRWVNLDQTSESTFRWPCLAQGNESSNRITSAISWFQSNPSSKQCWCWVRVDLLNRKESLSDYLHRSAKETHGPLLMVLEKLYLSLIELGFSPTEGNDQRWERLFNYDDERCYHWRASTNTLDSVLSCPLLRWLCQSHRSKHSALNWRICYTCCSRFGASLHRCVVHPLLLL